MTIDNSYLVGDYNVETARRLLGPEDFGGSEPAGCLEHLVLIIKQVAVCILRVLNFICGDHQWYNNQAAREIVERYANNHPEQDVLFQRVLQLYRDLERRANGNVSYAEGMDRVLLPSNVQCPLRLPLMGSGNHSSQIYLLREFSSMTASSTIFEGLPSEMRLEIFKKLDAQSLLRLSLTNVQMRNFILNDNDLYRDYLLELAIEKMLSLANSDNCALYEVVQAQVCINSEKALATANSIPCCKSL
jgi:hypothetical protein